MKNDAKALWFWIAKPLARGLAPIAAAVAVIAIIGAIAAPAVSISPLPLIGLALGVAAIVGAVVAIKAVAG